MTDAEINQLSNVIGVKDNILRFDIPVQDALLMAVLQAISDFSYLPLNCRLHDMPTIVNKLMVPVWRERVGFWRPGQELASRAVFQDQDEFVFKTSLVIDNLIKAINIRILTGLSESDHGLDFRVHDLHELVRCNHTMAILASMVLFLGAQDLLLPYF